MCQGTERRSGRNSKQECEYALGHSLRRIHRCAAAICRLMPTVKRAIDHTEHEKTRNPDTHLRVDNEEDT